MPPETEEEVERVLLAYAREAQGTRVPSDFREDVRFAISFLAPG